MSDTPIVSVIVPVYNGARHIRQCVESVLAQTFADFELICVDDGSTDDTARILADIAARDKRLHVIHQENKGEGAARNTGLAVARGRFLSFFDADDFTEPQLLERAIARAVDTDADIVAYRVDSYNDETGETLPVPWSLDVNAFPHRVSSPLDNPDELFYAFQNWTWNKLFRHNFIRDLDLRFHEIQRSADLYFVCCALAQAQRIATVDEVLYHYRVNNPNSNIATNERAPLDFHRSFLAVKETLERNGRFAPVAKGFRNWVAESVFFNLSSLKSREAFEELRQELQTRGCTALGLDEMEERDFRNPRTYTQVRHLLDDDADDFLFFMLREANRRAEEERNDALRAWREAEETLASKTYRAGNVVLKPLKAILGR